MPRHIMSTIISVVQEFSLLGALQLALVVACAGGMLMLFRPLLRGCARAAWLAVRLR